MACRSVATTSRVLLTPIQTAHRPLWSEQRRHASFSFGNLSSLFRRDRPKQQPAPPQPSQEEKEGAEDALPAGKGLFDIAAEQRVKERLESEKSRPTYHKSSTANFKTSKRKLGDLARLIAGQGVDEGVLQLQVSPKKQAPRLLSMLALARDHAIAKGMKREKLVIAQSWVTQGPSLKRLDIKGRGRQGIRHHPSSRLHVLLAEGRTGEERRRERKREQWRASIRGVGEMDSVGVGKDRRIINANIGGVWRW